jgi:hypothetical protein
MKGHSINYRHAKATKRRMGSLAWLGYLSHTQVVESSNLSPSIFDLSELFTLYPQALKPALYDNSMEWNNG